MHHTQTHLLSARRYGCTSVPLEMQATITASAAPRPAEVSAGLCSRFQLRRVINRRSLQRSERALGALYMPNARCQKPLPRG